MPSRKTHSTVGNESLKTALFSLGLIELIQFYTTGGAVFIICCFNEILIICSNHASSDAKSALISGQIPVRVISLCLPQFLKQFYLDTGFTFCPKSSMLFLGTVYQAAIFYIS